MLKRLEEAVAAGIGVPAAEEPVETPPATTDTQVDFAVFMNRGASLSCQECAAKGSAAVNAIDSRGIQAAFCIETLLSPFIFDRCTVQS